MLLSFYTLVLTILLQIRRGAVAFTTCVVPHRDGSDDSPGIHSLLSSCSSNSRILFEQGTTYNIYTPVDFGTLKNVEIAIEGNLELPKNISYVQNIVNGSKLHWFTVSGTNVTISGSKNPQSGWIEAFGEAWWAAAQLTNPGGLPSRPHAWSIKLKNSIVRRLKLRKPIAWGISLGGTDIHAYGINVDASYDLANPGSFPFNTDGIDVSGTNILIEDSSIFNGDDCIAVGANTHNVTIRTLNCTGGHGMSISGTNNISRVHFDRSYSQDSLYATRFKSALNSHWTAAWDTHTEVEHLYRKVKNATFPIFATGVYVDQNTNRGKTPGNFPANSTATKIKNFSWLNISGTVNSNHPGDGSCITKPCWYAVPGTTKREAIIMQLLDKSATNIVTKNINLTPIDGMNTADVFCNSSSFTDGGKSLGFVCRNGAYQATLDAGKIAPQ